MPRNDNIGLDTVQKAWAEAEAELADDAPEAVTEGASAPAKTTESVEHPVLETEADEDVDLLADLDETDVDEEEGTEQPPSGDSTTFTINGESVPLEELRKGYLRQSDYTKKTQELAEKEKELEKARTLYDAMRDDPVNTLNQLQAAVRSGQMPTQVKPAQAGQTPDADELARRVMEMLKDDPAIQQVRSAAEQKNLDDAFASIEKDFGLDKPLTAADRAKVIGKAEELGISSPDAYGIVFGGLLKEAERRRALRDSARRTASASGRGTSGADQAPDDGEYEDFWAAAQAAAKELGMEALLK